MIRHICMFTLKEENKVENIKEFVRRAEYLRNLSMIQRFEVVTNVAGTPDSNYDVALIFDFLSVEELDKYQKAPEHVAFGKFVSEVRETRACIDYEI